MFKKVSKLMLLAVSALMVFSACTDASSGDGNGGDPTPKTFLENVGGKSFSLVNNMTGGKNFVLDNGSIKSDDNQSIQFRYDNSTSSTTAVYIESDGNYFGVEYVADNKALNFYLAKDGTNAKYWATAAAVKFVAGTDVLLAAKTPNAVFVNGPFTDNVTTVTTQIPNTDAISAVFSSDFKLYALADNETPDGKGTLYTGGIVGGSIAVTGKQLPANLLEAMTVESLQLIGGVTPVIINHDQTEEKLYIYEADGTAPTAGTGEAVSLDISTTTDPLKPYAIGVEHVAVTDNAGTTKLHKISVTGFTTAGATLATMTPTSVVAMGTTNILVAGYAGNMSTSAVIDNVTIADGSKTSLSLTGITTTNVITVKLLVYGTDLYAFVGGDTNDIYKLNGTAWTAVTAIDNTGTPVTLPTTISSVDISGSVMYITSIDAAADPITSTTTAYLITPTALVKISAPNPTDGVITNVINDVFPAIVSLPIGLGILVIDVENLGGTAKVLRYNQFMATDAPFQMP